MATDDRRTTEVLQALAQPHRREILQLLVDGELAAGEIAEAFSVSRPAVSQHLRTLKEVGLVVERRDGTRRLYRLNPDPLLDLQRRLDQLWGNALHRARDLVMGEAEATRSEAG